MDNHAPEQTKVITLRPNTQWYTDDLRQAKQDRRRKERLWNRTGLVVHKQIYREQCVTVNRMLVKAKQDFYCAKLTECAGDQSKLHKLTRDLLGLSSSAILPVASSTEHLAQLFIDFFSEKITKIRDTISTENADCTSSVLADDIPFTGTSLVNFRPATVDEVQKVLMKSPTSAVS
jgi:hypothetical protein